MKTFFVGFSGVIAALYLVAPTMGIIEVIPDFVPVIGNLDEATAIIVLISALQYFGVDLGFIGRLFGKRTENIFGNKDKK